MRRETPGKWREKQKIEHGEEKPKELDGFEINCIWSSLGKLDFERFFGMEESH
jgi:hypothetical protein